MKKSFISILLIIATLLTLALPVYAGENDPTTIQTSDGSSITYFNDGSILTISAAQIEKDQSSTRATAKSVTASKIASYSDSSGNVEWEYKLTATFSYTSGVSSTCTNASYTKTINDSSWSFSNGSATKSGNVATGKGTFKYQVLFITINTSNVNITLTCDKNGNVT